MVRIYRLKNDDVRGLHFSRNPFKQVNGSNEINEKMTFDELVIGRNPFNQVNGSN